MGKRVPLSDESGTRNRGQENQLAAEVALAHDSTGFISVVKSAVSRAAETYGIPFQSSASSIPFQNRESSLLLRRKSFWPPLNHGFGSLCSRISSAEPKVRGLSMPEANHTQPNWPIHVTAIHAKV